MDKLSNRKWAGFLNALARKVNPWLNPKGEIVLRPYYWTMRQSEYATDIMFKDKQSLEEIYPALIRYAIEELGTEDILRFCLEPRGLTSKARFVPAFNAAGKD
jgi:hypothetical protein